MDPTRIEQEILAQSAARQKEHERKNHERMLGAEEKRKKKLKKLFGTAHALNSNQATGKEAALFKIPDFSSKIKWKLGRNATQNALRGRLVSTGVPNFHILIVEGVPKSINRYKKLVLNRIKNYQEKGRQPIPEGQTAPVAEPEDEYESEEEAEGRPKAVLVWSGDILQNFFHNWAEEEFGSEDAARTRFQDWGCVHYFDMAKNYSADINV